MQSDEELLDLLLSGDGSAFSELVDRYHTRLLRLAAAVVNRELAEDAAQDTWVAVLRGVERFERRSAFHTWLFRICVNRARTAAGREHRTTPVDVGGPSVDPARFTSTGQWSTPPLDWTDSVDDRVVAADLAPLAMKAIEGLPEVQRQVVTLRDVEGLTSTEVCDVLSLSPANERVLLHRGRTRVRAALEDARSGR